MDCPRTRLEHAKKALRYGCRVTVDCDGLIGIHGWDWSSMTPITQSAIKGLRGETRQHAVKMMAHPGFMGKESASSGGLLTKETKRLYK